MTFRGALRVDDFEGARGRLARDRLHAGDQVVVRDLGLRLDGNRLIVVRASAWSQIAAPESPRVQAELDEAEARYRHLLASVPELRDLTRDRSVLIELVSDYDTGTVLLAARTPAD